MQAVVVEAVLPAAMIPLASDLYCSGDPATRITFFARHLPRFSTLAFVLNLSNRNGFISVTRYNP
jgi:hypothetical protein